MKEWEVSVTGLTLGKKRENEFWLIAAEVIVKGDARGWAGSTEGGGVDGTGCWYTLVFVLTCEQASAARECVYIQLVGGSVNEKSQ